MKLACVLVAVAACGSQDGPRGQVRPLDPHREAALARLPRAPGVFAPSLVAIESPLSGSDISDGAMLSDVDSCSTCHPDAAAQWGTSPHSFASFGNPIYRVNVELARHELGRTASQHCGGCHDMPLMVDGLMAGDVPATDLRAHSGVTCRLCHGITSVAKDGNGSYVWSRVPLDAPVLGDVASIEKHRQQVSVKALGTELCVGCHRGFLSPDMGQGMPVHLSGLDEP
ncbi:MAG TPA: multiheme c-type cytochrome, partial [Kofleriaceae bacterium]